MQLIRERLTARNATNTREAHNLDATDTISY